MALVKKKREVLKIRESVEETSILEVDRGETMRTDFRGRK